METFTTHNLRFRDTQMRASATFTEDGLYRQTLWRIWNEALASVVICGVNPSTATHEKNDPTITRCIGFAMDWGFGSLCMVNAFDLRETDPLVMKKHPNPNSDANDDALKVISQDAGMVIAAWGVHGTHRGRNLELFPIFRGKLFHLGLTKDGHPKHPLYLPASTVPIPY